MTVVVLGGGGAYLWSQVGWVLSTPYRTVSYRVPDAPRLVAQPGQTIYRIDPQLSQVSYGVDETFIGAKANHATGSTNGIAGDIALDARSPANSRVGQIVVNLEQLHSDNSLRDARIRSAFLDSHDHPLATFSTTALSGLPSTLSNDRSYRFEMSGTMTVKGTTAAVSWSAEAMVVDGRLEATATTRVKMSTFGIGPISIVGLLSTADEVSLTMKLTALDPSKFQIPATIAAPTQPGTHTKIGGPSFSREVQPVLEASCAGCHARGQVGASHWQLTTAGDASKAAYSIGLVTTAKYMPPWPASPLGVPLAHSRALSPSTIDLISRWASAGGPLDVSASTPVPPAKGSQRSIRRDVVMKMTQPYTGSAASPNDYRCFVLDPHFASATFVTGYQFTPDQIQEIHHAQLFKFPASSRSAINTESGADGHPGFSCYGEPTISGGLPEGGGAGGYGLMAAWAPGQDPVTYPNAGVLFDPGDYVVLQVHYHYNSTPTPDDSTLALQTAPGTTDLPMIRIVRPVAPVEIPCAPADRAAPLCDRGNALAEDTHLYGLAGSLTESALLSGCKATPASLTAGFNGSIAATTCDTPVPADGTIISVFGHMHTLGKTLRLTLDPGTPQRKILLDIPTWNFDWQMVYQPQTPIHVHRGETVRIECTYDRAIDPTRAPKYILFNEGTEDEMCYSTYALVTQPPPTTGSPGP